MARTAITLSPVIRHLGGSPRTGVSDNNSTTSPTKTKSLKKKRNAATVQMIPWWKRNQ